MPIVSIVVPAYNAERYLGECLDSLINQSYRDIEVVIVDDSSVDETAAVARLYCLNDDRVRLIKLPTNSGTLAARRAGVLASRGDFVMLVDQDDELDPNAIERLVQFASERVSDIYHFGVRVVAENTEAQKAAAGMTGFLTPPPRRLEGESILVVQLAEENGFDWHVHHKLFRSELIRKAYSIASQERLILADDIYMSFILCSLAASYEAIPDSPWYRYHLGRGDTYGGRLTVRGFGRLAAAEGLSWKLARDYVNGDAAAHRDDWTQRLCDLRDRLIFHTMNEWMDGLSADEKGEALTLALNHYSPDAVCGELYRFVRDSAYALYVREDKDDDQALRLKREAMEYWTLAKRVEENPGFDVKNERYKAMKDIALTHLLDCGIISREAPRSRGKTIREKLHRIINRRSKI